MKEEMTLGIIFMLPFLFPLPAFLLFLRDQSLLATNLSSFTTSAANLRIPSPVFS